MPGSDPDACNKPGNKISGVLALIKPCASEGRHSLTTPGTRSGVREGEELRGIKETKETERVDAVELDRLFSFLQVIKW